MYNLDENQCPDVLLSQRIKADSRRARDALSEVMSWPWVGVGRISSSPVPRALTPIARSDRKAVLDAQPAFHEHGGRPALPESYHPLLPTLHHKQPAQSP